MLKQKSSLKVYKNGKFFIFAVSSRHSCRSFYSFRDFFGLATEATCSLTGLFLFHKSSLGQSHTNGAVTSRRTDGKGELLRVSVGLWMKTFSTDSHTNRLLGSVTVGSVSQEVF